MKLADIARCLKERVIEETPECNVPPDIWAVELPDRREMNFIRAFDILIERLKEMEAPE